MTLYHYCGYRCRCVNTRGGYKCVLRPGTGRHPVPRINSRRIPLVPRGVPKGFPCINKWNGDSWQQPSGGMPGWKLNEATKDCEDINECVSLTTPCLEGQWCKNMYSGYRCVQENPCGKGYSSKLQPQLFRTPCADNIETKNGTTNAFNSYRLCFECHSFEYEMYMYGYKDAPTAPFLWAPFFWAAAP